MIRRCVLCRRKIRRKKNAGIASSYHILVTYTVFLSLLFFFSEKFFFLDLLQKQKKNIRWGKDGNVGSFLYFLYFSLRRYSKETHNFPGIYILPLFFPPKKISSLSHPASLCLCGGVKCFLFMRMVGWWYSTDDEEGRESCREKHIQWKSVHLSGLSFFQKKNLVST